MKDQTEELLWIAAQEDNLIPLELIQFATKKNISLTELLEFSPDDLQGVSSKNVHMFMERKSKIEKADMEKCQMIWDRVQEQKVRMITYNDPFFPQNLKPLESMHTVLLYHKGVEIPFKNCIAIVGTRNCSTHASEFARELSMEVAKNNYVVVAGGARGIDAMAHRGALYVGGKTIAVLAWMFNPYPKDHEQLLKEIERDGCIISENFFSTKTMSQYKFVERNAIISGISDVLVAVESSITGGTSWQVQIALRQKKTVIAIEPKKDNEHAYKGFEKFVDIGAIPAQSIKGVVKIIDQQKENSRKLETKLLSEFS